MVNRHSRIDSRDKLTLHDTRALQAWLGHKNIQHTVRYTELAPDKFKNFWRD
jgi:site-specific recombinase XerD